MRAFSRILILLLACAIVPLSAQAQWGDDLPADSRIRLLHYNENDIYTLTTRVGYQSYIEFSDKENIDTISVGDRSFWQIIPSGNRLFIRPLQQDAATNMTVITNRFSYQFDLKSLSEPRFSGKSSTSSENDEEKTDDAKAAAAREAERLKQVVYVARFVYPEPPRPVMMAPIAPMPVAVQAAPIAPVMDDPFFPAPSPSPMPATTIAPAPYVQPQSVTLTPLDPARPTQSMPLPRESQRNYRYTFSGVDESAPYEIFDDSVTTYFRFKTPRSQPPQLASLEAGREIPLSVYRAGDYFATDAVAAQLVLRERGNTVLVFNEAQNMNK